MALSDKTQFDDRIAATFSTIPSKYPPLPNDVLKRFPSLESWQTEQSRVLARVREALDSMGSDFGIPLNKAQATQELLSKTVATQYDELSARITSETTILVDENQALAQRTTTIESTINTPTTGLLARINTVETTYATKDFALAKKEEAITAAVTTANGYTAGQITSLSSVYATPTFVETKKTEAITAAVSSANSSTDGKISALSSVYATPTFVETKKTEAITAAVSSANSSTDGKISALSSVYATPLFVETKKTEAISAAASAATGYTDGQISSLSSVYATPTQVTSTVNNLISASVTSPTAGTIGAAIETERLARANADGNLSGKFSLKVTAGNVVTGMNITSSTGAGTDVSSVTFLASEFKIFNSATGIAPFAVIDGVVHAQNVSISGTLLVSGSIAASRLNFTPVTSTNVVASINATAEGIQISGSRIQINGSTTFSSGYDPTSKITTGGAASDVNANTTTINGGKITARSILANQIQAGAITANEILAGTITTTQLNFTPVTSTNVIASINATIEGGLRIAGSKIEISGSTTFSSGYDPSTKLTPGSAAADVNANVTTINGGKITANTITASQIAANSITADKIVTSGLSLTSSQISGLGTLAGQNTVSNSQVTGLGSLATLSTIGTSLITGLAATATNSDFSAITGATKPANNADVTLVAINGGITITSNGLTLAGSGANAASIRSQNYVPGTSGWAIAANGDVEFASGFFRGNITGATGTFSGNLSAAGGTFSGTLVAAGGTFSGALSAATGTFSGNLSAAGGTFSGALSAATGTFSGTLVAAGGTFSGALVAASGSFVGMVDIGSGMTRTRIDSGGLKIGSYVEWNTDGGTDTYLKFTASDPNHSNRQMVIRSGSNAPSIVIGSDLYTTVQSRGFYADGFGSTIRTLTVYDSLYVTGGNLSVTNAATINGNTYSGSFSSNGNASFNSLTVATTASISGVLTAPSISGASFTNSTFNLHPSSNNSMGGGEDGGTAGATTSTYIAIRYNGRTVWVPFFTALP